MENLKAVSNGIPGEDTGCIKQKFFVEVQELLNCNRRHAEVFIWFIIQECKKYLDNHKTSDPDYQGYKYAFAYLKALTRTFGVTIDSNSENDSFDNWYNFWHNHFYKMPKAIKSRFDLAYIHKGDITEFLPNESWND